MMMSEQRQFQVFRYKQGQAESPTFRTFTVTVGPRTTVLDGLQEIRRTQDSTLILRHSCHHASCGTCGMKVNGREVLACVTNVAALGDQTVVVEPLDNALLVGDLVVDMGGFYGRYTAADMPYLRYSEFLPEAETPHGIPRFTRFENCLECGLCLSACVVMSQDSRYLGPAALAAAWRVVEEPKTADVQTTLNWVDQEYGCWRCHVAYECSAVCPSEVHPAENIMSLRGELSKRRLKKWFGR